MDKIFKYEIKLVDNFAEIPVGAKILHVNVQGNKLFVWANVNPTQKKVPWKFKILGTGMCVPDDEYDYITTVFMGSLVWHVFVWRHATGEE